MVLAVIVLGLPKHERRSALRYGMLGAFAFRTIAVLLAVYLIRLAWVKVVGAAYLLYLVFNHFGFQASAEARRAPPVPRSRLGMSPFWTTVVKVELTDLVFAVDSILVGVAMSPKRWVVVSGGILGIVMMRVVIAQILSLVERHPLLVDAAFVIIAWVGTRLIVEFLHVMRIVSFEIPSWLSLGLIVVIFTGALAYSLWRDRGNNDQEQTVDQEWTVDGRRTMD
jgi:YkoY family integral membrane protein